MRLSPRALASRVLSWLGPTPLSRPKPLWGLALIAPNTLGLFFFVGIPVRGTDCILFATVYVDEFYQPLYQAQETITREKEASIRIFLISSFLATVVLILAVEITPELVTDSTAAGYPIWVWPNDRNLENLQSYQQFLAQGILGLNINFPAEGVRAVAAAGTGGG